MPNFPSPDELYDKGSSASYDGDEAAGDGRDEAAGDGRDEEVVASDDSMMIFCRREHHRALYKRAEVREQMMELMSLDGGNWAAVQDDVDVWYFEFNLDLFQKLQQLQLLHGDRRTPDAGRKMPPESVPVR